MFEDGIKGFQGGITSKNSWFFTKISKLKVWFEFQYLNEIGA